MKENTFFDLKLQARILSLNSLRFLMIKPFSFWFQVIISAFFESYDKNEIFKIISKKKGGT